MTLSRPATALHLAMGTVCNSHKMRGRKLKTEGQGRDNFSYTTEPMKNYPDHDDHEDYMRRTEAELKKLNLKILFWIAVTGISLAFSIHMLATP